MINNNEKQVVLAFGTGDICVNAGHIEDYGIVAFSNQSPREINAVGDIKAGQKYNLDDFPVVMSFSKPESIDVVIEQLKKAKADMCYTNKCGTCKFFKKWNKKRTTNGDCLKHHQTFTGVRMSKPKCKDYKISEVV